MIRTPSPLRYPDGFDQDPAWERESTRDQVDDAHEARRQALLARHRAHGGGRVGLDGCPVCIAALQAEHDAEVR